VASISIRQGYEAGKAQLREFDLPELESKLLVLEASGVSENEFYSNPERMLSSRQYRRLHRLISLRRKGFPVAYLTRKKEFWSLIFQVGHAVLIPRPETELLVEQVINVVSSEAPVVVDVGTGSGNIAVALARELPGARIFALDISRGALRTARRNAKKNDVSGVAFLKGDLLAPLKKPGLEGKVDVIVSNPPYVSRSEWEVLPTEIREHEPKAALVSGETGLELINRLVVEAFLWLKPGGYLIMEFGSTQKDAVRRVLDAAWKDVRYLPDLSGFPRICRARRA